MQERSSLNSDFSAEIPDWRREKPRRFWDLSRRLLLSSGATNTGGGAVAEFSISIIVTPFVVLSPGLFDLVVTLGEAS
jgi:hypothetical protein